MCASLFLEWARDIVEGTGKGKLIVIVSKWRQQQLLISDTQEERKQKKVQKTMVFAGFNEAHYRNTEKDSF